MSDSPLKRDSTLWPTASFKKLTGYIRFSCVTSIDVSGSASPFSCESLVDDVSQVLLSEALPKPSSYGINVPYCWIEEKVSHDTKISTY